MKGAGGGKRGGRKPANVESDDRPRGYEATRMRRLWQDIDDAKHKAGLGPPALPQAAPAFDMAAVMALAAAIVGEATLWMTANAPVAWALLTSGAELLRGLPIVGRLVDLVPGPPGSANGHGTPGAGPAPHANGVVHPTIVAPEKTTDPDGGWMH